MQPSGQEIKPRRIETHGAHKPRDSQIDRNKEVGGLGERDEKEIYMKPETHTPQWQDPNGIAGFVRHQSRPNGPADQSATEVSLPHVHPDLGRVVTIKISALKDGNKGNTVILHLPIKKLSEWVTQSLPDTPKCGVDSANDDISLDFSDIDLGTGE